MKLDSQMKLDSIEEKLVGAIELSDEELAAVVGGDRGRHHEERRHEERRHEERRHEERRHR